MPNLTETDRTRIDIRVPQVTHAAIAAAATRAGVSINAWATMVLGLAAGASPDLALAIEVFGTAATKTRRKARRTA